MDAMTDSRVSGPESDMNKFICVDCGELFESLAPPAETRDDDPEPRCCPCIERELDSIEAEPLDDATIERIMAKVVLRRNIASAVNAKMWGFFQSGPPE